MPLSVSLAGPAMPVLCQPWCCSSAAGAQVLLPLLLPLRAPFVPFQGQELAAGSTECIGGRERTGVVEDWHCPEKRGDSGTAPPAPCHHCMSCSSPQLPHMILWGWGGQRERGELHPKTLLVPGSERLAGTKMLAGIVILTFL